MQYFPHLCILHKKFIKFNYKIKSKKNMKKFKFGVLAMAGFDVRVYILFG